MKPDQRAWSASVVWLHWAGAVLILGLIAIGFAMRHLDLPAANVFDLFQQHKSFGFVALALTLVRLALRLGTASPRSRARGGERVLAWLVQALLYLLSFAAIGAGWLAASASPIPVPTRLFGWFIIPNLTRPDAALYSVASYVHAVIAYAILVLVGAHVAGALKHFVVDRDDTLARMLGRAGSERPAATKAPEGNI